MSSLLAWRTSWRSLWELLLLLLYVTGGSAHVDQTPQPAQHSDSACFYPGGQISLGRSCHPKAANSACCSPGFTCLSNGVCSIDPSIQKDYKYTFYRSSCTDRTWKDPSCPQFCVGGQDNRTAGHGLQVCSHDQGTYCCRRDDVDCCFVPELVVKLGKGDPILTFPKLHNPDRPTSHNVVAPGSSSTVSVSTEPRNYSRVAIIGLSVGFSLAIVFAAIIGWFRCLRRKRHRRGRIREYEGKGSKLSVNKDVDVSVSALGEHHSSIELQSVSTDGTRQPDRRSPTHSVMSGTRSSSHGNIIEHASRSHMRQQGESRPGSVRRISSRDSHRPVRNGSYRSESLYQSGTPLEGSGPSERRSNTPPQVPTTIATSSRPG